MIYGRPYSRDVFCPECESSNWSCLTDCTRCGRPVCDQCDGAECADAINGHMLCAYCVRERDTIDGIPIEQYAQQQIDLLDIVLAPITSKVKMPDVPEWKEATAPKPSERR